MSISQNYPNVSPQLLIELSNTQKLDPRIAFARASTGTYYGANGVLRTEPSGVARFQFNPVTGESEGLLRENQATNLLTYSEDFTNAYWSLGSQGVTRASNVATSPNGTLTADKITTSTLDEQHRFMVNRALSIDGSTRTTISLFINCDPGVGFHVNIGSGGGNQYFQTWVFDGVLYLNNNSTPFNPSRTLTDVGSGWYRLEITFNHTSDTATIINSVWGLCDVGGNTAFLGDGTSGIYLWGAQLEANSFATSYIKTVASQVTRAADVATLTNVDAYNTDEFTAVTKPFGVAGVASNLVTLNGDAPIERLYVYPRNISQNEINTLVENDGWWNWRIVGADFALPNFTTDGTVIVDWGDGTVETLTTAVHTFTNASPHTVRFRMGSGTTFRPFINSNATHRLKVVALGSAPSNMIVNCLNSFNGLSNLKSIDATLIGGTNFNVAWQACPSLTSFPLIDTSSGTSFRFAWSQCALLTSFPQINTSSATSLEGTWDTCVALTSFPLIDASNVTSLSAVGTGAWRNCSSLTSFPAIDFPVCTNFERAWSGCSSLTSFPLINTSSGTNFKQTWFNCNSLTDFPLIDTSSGTTFQQAWFNCNSLTSFPLINTSSGTSFLAAWQNCSSLTSFPLIDTSLGTNFTSAWAGCAGLTSFPLTNTSAGTSFSDTWRSCNSLTSFPLLDMSLAENLNECWDTCTSLTSFPAIDFPVCTNFDQTWRNCSSLTSFPLIDTSSGTNFSSAWRSCSSLTSFPLIDTSSGTSFSATWRECNSLTSFPLINTSAGLNFSRAWQSCSSLTSFPLIDTSSGTSFSATWYLCNSLTSFPLIDTSSGTNFDSAWYGCTSLTSFPLIDTSSGTDFTRAWQSCSSLTSFPLINTSSGTDFIFAWTSCTSLTDFPANFFDSWVGVPTANCFLRTWDGCSALTTTSVENILVSIDTSGVSAPATGTEITIDYDTGTGALTSATNTAITSLKAKNWTIKINGVLE